MQVFGMFRWASKHSFIRTYRVLAIESSCDDSCVAILERHNGKTKVLDNCKRTLDSVCSGGIIPTKAHEFHQKTLPNLVKDMIQRQGKPDLVCCTRGPGMVGSLSSGLQLAKGLAIGFDVPLIGVHHMLGHILISKLATTENHQEPKYPFLSLLCSGGHTMLVLSRSLTDHEIVINTFDIAVGDSLDKCGREIGLKGVMIGKELEKFVADIPKAKLDQFKNFSTDNSKNNPFGYALRLPLKSSGHKKIPETIGFSFAGFLSSIHTFKRNHDLTEDSRQFLAWKIQEIMFDHIIDRIKILFLKHKDDGKFEGVRDFIFSGGVASNKKFREKLGQFDYKFHFPDPSLCTDNAIMIGVTGIEIYEQLNLKSDLSVNPITKWPMDELLKVDGWVNL